MTATGSGEGPDAADGSAATGQAGGVPVEYLAAAGLAAYPVSVAADAIVGTPLVRPLVAFAALTLLPGALLLPLAGVGPRRTEWWWLYAVGTSLVVVLGVGLVTNLVLPVAGVASPMSVGPLLATYGALVGGLAAVVRRRAPPDRRVALRVPRELAPRALALLPVGGILSVAVLNRTGENGPLLLVLAAGAAVPVAVATGRLAERWHPLALWAAGAALLYHKSLWQFHEFSGQANVVAAWQFGRWSPHYDVPGAATASLLPNVVLYPTYARLGGLDIFTQLHVLNPLLVSLIPIAAYATFGRYVPSREAFLAAAVLVVAHPFYFQFPTAGRVAPPVLFLVLLTCAATDPDLPALPARALALAFSAGIVVSHYGASYFVLFGFVGAQVLLAALRAVDGLVDVEPTGVGGDGPAGADAWLSPAFVGFYGVSTLAWYIYTFGGRKFDVLVAHVSATVADLYEPSTGGTASRLAHDYGAVSIQLSKGIYVGLAALTAVGLAAVYLRRFRGERVAFDDTTLALATMLVGVYGLSFVSRGAWGGGRPLMLTFAVAGVFTVAGAHAVGAGVVRAARADGVPDGLRRLGARAPASFAVVLSVLLLLNTGALAAVALDGYAPSNVPLQERIESADDPHVRQTAYDRVDLRTNVWVVDHYDPEAELLADFIAQEKNNDWNRPRLVFEAERRPPVLRRYDAEAVRTAAPAYVLLAGHNTQLEVFVVSNRNGVPLRVLTPTLDARDRVYATEYTSVYYDTEGTRRNSTADDADDSAG